MNPSGSHQVSDCPHSTVIHVTPPPPVSYSHQTVSFSPLSFTASVFPNSCSPPTLATSTTAAHCYKNRLSLLAIFPCFLIQDDIPGKPPHRSLSFLLYADSIALVLRPGEDVQSITLINQPLSSSLCHLKGSFYLTEQEKEL